MKKYILKKDLPFAKAGTEVDIVDGEGILFDGYHCDYVNTGELVEKGWIEEVKPRTFYINRMKSGELIAYYLEHNAREDSVQSETIKVVECI